MASVVNIQLQYDLIHCAGIDSSDESDADDLLSWQRNWLLSSSDEDDNEDE